VNYCCICSPNQGNYNEFWVDEVQSCYDKELWRVKMGSHPINLAVRFLLEVVALLAMAYWGWTQHEGIFRFIWAIGLPLVTAVIWGTFAVQDDPSRSGDAPIPVPGILRLLLELAFFAVATWAIMASGFPVLGLFFAVVVTIHYLVSYGRVVWLIRQ